MLNFTSATGRLFNRLGAIFNGFLQEETYQNTTLPTYITSIENQYASGLSIIPNMQNWLISAQPRALQIKTNLQLSATKTIYSMVQADAPQPTIDNKTQISKLIVEMKAAGATVKKNTVSASVSAASSNVGNGVCIVSLVDAGGTTLENVFAEVLSLTCTRDSQPSTGLITSGGQEIFTASGIPSVAKLDSSWPGGSGGTTSVVSSSADVSGSIRNIVTNGNFDLFTTNVPNGWTLTTGTAGATVGSTGTSYRGATALSITGNGSELTKLTQTIRDTAAPTPGTMMAYTKYVLAFRLRVSAVPAGGVLRVSLKDGSNAIIASSNVSVTLSAATTSYVLYNVIFNAPVNLPDQVYCVVELTTALDNAKSVYIDDLVITPMVQHQHGPFVAVIPGNIKFVKGDAFYVTMSNNYAGKFQTMFNRMFDMDTLGLVLPSATSGSETISDTLIA